MAGVSSDENLTSHDNESEIIVSKNTMLDLLMKLISAEGACAHLQHKLDQLTPAQEKNLAALNISADGIFHDPQNNCRQIMNPTANISTLGLPLDKGQNSDIKNQGLHPGPEWERSSKETDKQINADHLLVVNSVDSKLRQGGRKSLDSKNSVTRKIVITGPNQISENIEVNPKSRHMELNQNPKYLLTEPEIEPGGSPITTLSASNFLGSRNEQSSPAHKLYRSSSSKEDNRKRKEEMKKTGSHDSYFPHNGYNDRSSGVQRRPRKLSYTPGAAGPSTNAQGKQDNFMMAYLPQIVSQTIFNGVIHELRRIKKEYFCLMEREEEMIAKIQQLEGDLKLLKAEKAEREKAHEERKKTVDEFRSFERANLLFR